MAVDWFPRALRHCINARHKSIIKKYGALLTPFKKPFGEFQVGSSACSILYNYQGSVDTLSMFNGSRTNHNFRIDLST